MGALVRRWRERTTARALAHYPAKAWKQAWDALPLLAGLDAGEAQGLQALAAQFLRSKTIEAVQGASLEPHDQIAIALQACLPVLHLGLSWYQGWYAVIVYPEEFVLEREHINADGVVWIESVVKSGEAWEQGPVILSWADVEAGMQRDGYNVVIHELAHKLDMRSGPANGHPPLHAGMSDGTWARDLGAAYAAFVHRVDRHGETAIDPYGAESPGEFFAVCSEAFFEIPHPLRLEFPAVYTQLAAFYRQDPIARLEPVVWDEIPRNVDDLIDTGSEWRLQGTQGPGRSAR
ncbi:MAG: zinc-dependent peptidase [Chromatiaceae bacterium]|nr:zinc-dependent peptidase [Chromatiaceae bacterium]